MTSHSFELQASLLLIVLCVKQKGHTALLIAALCGHTEVVKLLVDRGAQLDWMGKVMVGGVGATAFSSFTCSAFCVLCAGCPVDWEHGVDGSVLEWTRQGGEAAGGQGGAAGLTEQGGEYYCPIAWFIS